MTRSACGYGLATGGDVLAAGAAKPALKVARPLAELDGAFASIVHQPTDTP